MKRPNKFSKPLGGDRLENYHPADFRGQYVKDLNTYIDFLEDSLEWNDATKVFPPFDKKVLGYYTLPATDGKGKKTGEIYEYFVVVMCESVTESSNRKSALWRDSDYNTINPSHWRELQPPPNK